MCRFPVVPSRTQLLLAPRANIKTTSGKIARQWCRRAFLEGKMKPLVHLKSAKVDDSDGGAGASGGEGKTEAGPSTGIPATAAAAATTGGRVVSEVAGAGVEGATTDAAQVTETITAVSFHRKLFRGRSRCCRLTPDPVKLLYTSSSTPVLSGEILSFSTEMRLASPTLTYPRGSGRVTYAPVHL